MPTINGSCDNSRYILTCEYSFTQNVSANTSTITAKVYLNGNGYTTTSSYWSCVINGTTVTSNKSASIGGKTLLGSKTWTVNHASDGTCKTTISFSYKNGLSSAGTYTTRSGSGSSSVTLTTIPRASSFTLNRTSATIGSDQITATISRSSSSFTHTVIYKFGSITADQVTKTTATSVSFTPAIGDCNQIPNATSGTGTVIVDTYNGSTKIGTASKSITLNVPSSVVPTIGSVTATGNNLLSGIYVAGKSTVTAKINSAAGAYGSTIKSYSISGAGISSSSSSATSGVLGAGSYTITGKVTDSRGRTASKSTSITVHSYYAPSLSIDLYRCNSDGTKNDSGTYARVYINQSTHNIGNANVNAKQYKIDWKKASSTSWTTFLDWTNIGGYEDKWTHDLKSGWDNTVTYDVRVSIRDSYNTVSASSSIGTISCVMNIERAGIGIGKPHERGALDIAGNVYASDSVLTDNCIQVGKNKRIYGLTSDGTQLLIAGVASHNGIDVGSSSANTAVCSSSQPTWWNGSTSRHLVYSENDSGGYPAIMSNNGNSWIRTPSKGMIPHTSGTGSGRSDIGSDSWRFSTGYFNNVEATSIVYAGRNGSDFGGGFVARRYLNNKQQSAKCMIINTGGGCASILHRDETNSWEVQFLVQAWSAGTGCVRPNNNGGIENGTSAYKWKVVYASNGTIQTSDERFKVKRGYVDTDDCFKMVKETSLYNYILLDQNKDELSKSRLGKLAMSNNEDEAKVHMGIMAQDIQKYDCGKQILVENEYEKSDGTKDTMLHINPLDMTMSLMGALQKEIEYREKLEKRVEQLEELIQQLVSK